MEKTKKRIINIEKVNSLPREMESFLFNKTLQFLIKKGYKIKAFNIFCKVLQKLKYTNIKVLKKIHRMLILYQCVSNVKPLVYITKVKKPRRIFYLPKIVTRDEQIKLSLFWLVKATKLRKEKTWIDRFYNEIVECYSGKGLAIQKKFEFYDMVESQRPFLHLIR